MSESIKSEKVFVKLDQNLHELRVLVLTMAGYVEESVDVSMKALVLRDRVLLKRVWEIENEVNSLHKKIDNVCFKILACQSPVATDLRLILAIIKMNVDLERMGDLVCKNSNAIASYLDGSPNLIVQEIRQMATTVVRMVRDCFDAFMDRDLLKAQTVLSIDDAVDAFRNKMSEELREALKSPIADIETTMSLLAIIRNLERLADHATNIAEEVIFYLTGFDVRHKTLKTPKEDSDER
jgi:phosphate transport system protein